MPEETVQEKTEPATPHRREEARKKGQVARSIELNSFAVIFFGTLFLLFAGPALARDMAALMRQLLANLHAAPASVADSVSVLTHIGLRTLAMLAPLFIAVVIVSVFINATQVGFRITPEALKPKPEKLNFTKGFKRLFSRRSFVELVRDVLKLSVIGAVAYFAVRAERDGFLALADADVSAILSAAGWAIFRVGIKIILALFLLAVADYAFQKWDFERSIRMTKHELKEELRQHEGSPQLRSRIRQVQRELARMRMAREVPKADVVVTNPVSLAVALKYDVETMSAPTVVAKGARLLAEKIRRIAREAGVPIVENKPLARALYASVDVGGLVPAELYKATAEILAYVYRLRGEGSGWTESESETGRHRA